MAWLLLGTTILLEVAGTTLMKLSAGFTAFWPSVGVFVCYAAALAGIVLALEDLELSIAYAVWSGAGTALTTLVGITFFNEPVGVVKVLSVGLVLIGIVGMQLASTGGR